MPLLLLLLVLFVGTALYRQFATARERSQTMVVPAVDRPAPPRHQRVTDSELRRRSNALRSAVKAKSISANDAVKSLARTCGLETEDARAMLGLGVEKRLPPASD